MGGLWRDLHDEELKSLLTAEEELRPANNHMSELGSRFEQCDYPP